MASVYTQIFDSTYDKDEGLYKILFTTPVHEDALHKTIIPNLQRVVNEHSDYNRQVTIDMLRYGVTFLNDALDYDSNSEPEGEENNDDDGDDITSMKTDQVRKAPRTRQFADIDDELRSELISNILHTLQTWFVSVYDATKHFRTDADSDLTLILFGEDSELDQSIIVDLLIRARWYLERAVRDISNDDGDAETQYLQLPVIKEVILLVASMLRMIFLSLAYNPSSTIPRSLLSTFESVNLTDSFNQLLVLTAATKTNDVFAPPKIRLSAETLVILYGVLGSLSHVHRHVESKSVSPLPAAAADITTLEHNGRSTPAVLRDKTYTRDLFYQEIASRIIPILAMEFNYCHSYKPDLLIQKLSSSSFFGWLTGSAFSKEKMYADYHTEEVVTNFEPPECRSLSIYDDEDDPYVVEVRSIQQIKIDRRQMLTEYDDLLEMPELLPISLVLSSLVDNPSFVEQLLTPELPITQAIEDLDPMQDRDLGLLDVWLCVASYVLEYQYRSRHFQTITKLILFTLAKLCSSKPLPSGVVPVVKFGEYRINEFKWKVCRQRLPLVPIDEAAFGIKSGIFYTLDVLQNLLRFNLTNKLKIDNYQLAINIGYEILVELKRGDQYQLSHYHWDELYRSIFSVFKFFVMQKLWKSSHFINLGQVDNVRATIEEIVAIIDLVLCPRLNRDVEEDNHNISLNYHLVYNILLHYDYFKEVEKEITGDFHVNAPRLAHCLDYFEQRIYLSETSKSESSDKMNVQDYSVDSAQFQSLINQYLLDPELELPTEDFKPVEKLTFKYVRGDFNITPQESIQVVNFTLAPDNRPMSRFFQERAGEDSYRQK